MDLLISMDHKNWRDFKHYRNNKTGTSSNRVEISSENFNFPND